MIRLRIPSSVLLLCIVSWGAMSFADLNSDFKTEVNLAPMGSGRAPTYADFLLNQGFEILRYFLPYGPSILIWCLSLAFFLLQFMPALAAKLAAHKFVRWLCIAGGIWYMYTSFDLLLSFPAKDRNGCFECEATALIHIAIGAVLMVCAAISRSIHLAKHIAKSGD